MTELVRVLPEDREALWQLNQKYLYEMTRYYPELPDDEGLLHYGYFDLYFSEEERLPLFLCEDGKRCGFAFLNRVSYLGKTPDHVLAEFTVFPALRGRGLGLSFAEKIFMAYPGTWEVKYHEGNRPARALWLRATAPFAPVRTGLNESETVLSFRT